MTTDPAAIIEALGGGAAAVLVVFLAMAVIALWRRDQAREDRQQKMIEDWAKERREDQATMYAALKANDTTLTAATAAMQASIEEQRRRPK